MLTVKPSVAFHYVSMDKDGPFQRLMKKHQLIAYNYDGFWASLDTYKDKQRLDEIASKNVPLWEIWNHNKILSGDKKNDQ